MPSVWKAMRHLERAWNPRRKNQAEVPETALVKKGRSLIANAARHRCLPNLRKICPGKFNKHFAPYESVNEPHRQEDFSIAPQVGMGCDNDPDIMGRLKYRKGGATTVKAGHLAGDPFRDLWEPPALTLWAAGS